MMIIESVVARIAGREYLTRKERAMLRPMDGGFTLIELLVVRRTNAARVWKHVIGLCS
jgi:hypothetical protein